MRKDIEQLIADLDKGRAEGDIYTYGQVQERLRAILEAPEVPEHLTQDGFVHYLTKSPNLGVWWVSTRKDGQPWASQPLSIFLEDDGK